MMDFQQMSMMAEAAEAEQRRMDEKRVTIPCYGCNHLCASPMDCTHPGGMSVKWDPVRNRTYRLPSISLCLSERGMCKHYEPHAQRGAEFAAIQQKLAGQEHADKVTRIDTVLDKAGDGETDIEDFIDEITKLAEDLEAEDKAIIEKEKGDKSGGLNK